MSSLHSALWLVVVAAFVLAWWLRRQRGRLRLLTTYVDALAAGEVPPPLPEPLGGALGNLQLRLSRVAAAEHARLGEARAAQRRLEDVLGGMIEGVLVIDSAGTVVLGNSRAEVLLDLPQGDLPLGRPLIELTRHPDLHELVRDVMGDGGVQRPFVRDIHLEGGKQMMLQVTATPMPAPNGLRSFILVFHDVSDMKRLERIRRDFVANVSHELRTPLAAIGGYAETLLGGALDDPLHARRFLAIIERHTVRLGRLVDDLLTLSDLELGRTELRRVAVQADGVVEATFEVLRNKAQQAGIALTRDVAPDTPALDADEDRLEQALVNLVDNAIKYTPSGGHVTVSAGAAAAPRLADGTIIAAADGLVEIAVADTGIGVPPEDLSRLTERFYRVDKARSRELGGTGLGLAIVKHIVQAHGGWMRIESELGKGTTVRLYLPRYRRTDGPVE